MNSNNLIQLVILGILLAECGAQFVGPCHRSDPQVNNCLKNLMNQLFYSSRHGKAEPRINDVIRADKIAIESSQDFLVRGSLDNVQIKGLNSLRITDVRSKLSKYRIDLKFFVPELELRSKYELLGGGKILLFPFEARGNNWIDITGLTGIVKLQISRVQRDNEIFMQIDKSLFDFNFRNAKFKFVDRNSEFLGPILSQVVNSNPALFINTLKKQINSVLGETIRKIFQSMLIAPENNYIVD